MRIQLVNSTVGENAKRHFATSYVINEHMAIDCGPLGFWKEPDDQAAIRNLFLTHTHADHIATLPIFLENAYEGSADPVCVWGSESVLDSVRRDIFNDRIWPNLIRIADGEERFFHLRQLEDDVPVEVDGVRVTPVQMNHLVPTHGFIVDDGETAIALASDTGPTEQIWHLANQLPHLRAVFLEASFPNRMIEFAKTSFHLTPELFAIEARKLERDVEMIAIHIKPRFRKEIAEELAALNHPRLSVGGHGSEVIFNSAQPE